MKPCNSEPEILVKGCVAPTQLYGVHRWEPGPALRQPAQEVILEWPHRRRPPGNAEHVM